MKRRLILHLGLSKTGTTSIQGFFRQSPDALAAAGIVYPKVGASLPNHPSYQPSVLKPRVADETNHSALAREIDQRSIDTGDESDRTPLWSAAFRQIEDSGAHTAIVSYEGFATHPIKYRFGDIEGHLRNFDVKGIVYLRNQEYWAVSTYGQRISGNKRFSKPFSKHLESLKTRLVYSELLDTIRGHIPLDHLVVGNFDEASRSGLLEDFFDKTGLPRDLPLPAGEQKLRNRSHPYAATLFLLKCNQAGLSDAAFLQVREAFAAHTKREKDFGLRPGLDTAAPYERQALRKVTADDAERLARRYGVTLSAEPREAVAYRPFDEDDFMAIKEAIAPGLTQATLDALKNI